MRKPFQSIIPILLGVSVACDGRPVSPIAIPDGSITSFASAAAQGAILATVRAATSQYHRVEVANADGYLRVTPCVYNTAGSKGIHFPKPLLFDAVVDPAHPEVLLYEMTKNGEYRLVGVEFLVPAAAWDASHSGPPMLGDQPFMDRRLPPFGADFPNYALYVWLWRHNPNGMYEQYNPQVSCEFADASIVR
jgi:hypothetical protein